MDQATGRRRRRIGRIAAAVIGAALLVATVLPLVVRGPVARWAVAQVTSSLCGSFRIGGGHLGWAAVWQLAFGRPVPLVVDDVRIVGPDGKAVFVAERFQARLEFQRGPFRLVITEAMMAHGEWRLALRPNAIGTLDAFRSVPPAGRQACLDPRAARPAAKGGGGGGSITLRDIEFEDVGVDLDFPTWQLELAHANAEGMLAAGGSGPPLVFDVRDVIASGGALRVGQRGDPWSTRVPFQAVAITRVGVSPDAPTDLRLEVAGGSTGQARLSGHAAFLNIFPARVGARPSGTPGLDADVRWTHLGAVLTALEAGWRPRPEWASHLDGDLRAEVSGPFTGLSGTLQVDGGGSRLAARVAHGRADLTMALAGIDTTWMLAPSLRPLLGGLAHGRFHATARLAPSFGDIDAEIPEADLRLDRRHNPGGPRRFQLRIGKAGDGEGAVDTLYATIAGVRLAHGTLRLEDLRLDWTGLRARLDAEAEFPHGAAPGDPAATARERSRVSARGTLAVAALEDWIPGAAAGPLKMSADARGTLERIDVTLAFPPPGTLGLYGQRYLLPRRLDFAMGEGVGFALARFQLRRVGGGAIEAGGRLEPNGRLVAAVTAHAFPLGALPGLDADLGRALGGTADADLSAGGTRERPTLRGKLAIVGLAYRRHRIGDLQSTLRVGADGGEADATLGPGVAVHARIRRRAGLNVDATVALRDQPLGAWLPPPLAGAPLAASGDGTVAYHEGAPLAASGIFALTGPGLSHVQIELHADKSEPRAHVAGEIDLARWPQLWSRVLTRATGTLGVDLSVDAIAPRPRVVGSVRIAHPLVLQTPRWPAPLEVAGDGRLDLDGDRLTVSAISLATAGLRGSIAGQVVLDPADIARTRLALALKAVIDPARFPVLPAGASARGQVTVDAQVSGTVGGRPGPEVDGHARLDDVTLRLSPSAPAMRAHGVIDGHGDMLRAQALQVDITNVGTVVVGGGGTPAEVQLVSLAPLRLGRVEIPFSGDRLTLGDPNQPLYLPNVDAQVRLTGDARRDLTIAGQIAVAGGSFDASRKAKRKGNDGGAAKPRVSGPWYRMLPPHLTLDLLLRGSNRGINVAVPVLPDVSVDFQCHLVATNRGATWTGNLRGNSAYGRAALTLYDWFSSNDFRKCQLTR